MSSLAEHCPELVEAYGDELCCSQDQVDTLGSNFVGLELVYGNCPACYSNLKRLFCEMTCSPLQYRFMNVTSTNYSTKGSAIVVFWSRNHR